MEANSSLLVRPLLRWKDVTLGDFVERFKDPLLRRGLMEFLQFARPDFSVLMLLITLAQMADKVAGYPIGGSLELADRGGSLSGAGGQIHFNARVTKILVQDDQAIGVQLADGTEHYANQIISAADGHATIFDLLGGVYADKHIHDYYQTLPVAPSILQVALGANRDFRDQPPAFCFPLTEPLTLATCATTISPCATTPLTRRWPTPAKRRSTSGAPPITATGRDST
ncbi:MAG: hypothetical protein R2867_39155 [Caldilineaceae bacterium]